MKHKKMIWVILCASLMLTSCDAIYKQIKRVGDIQLGTAHSAHELCSRIFVSNQDVDLIIEDVLVQKVYPLEWIWKVDIDYQNKIVSVGAPFTTALNNATAVYREGQGCTLTHGKSREELYANAIKPIEIKPTLSINDYWPLGSLGVSPDSSHYNQQAITAAVDEMFHEFSQNRFQQINTYAVLVVHKGKLINEKYSAKHTKDNRLPGWSISKSITALLLGLIVDQGKVTLSFPITMENESKSNIALRHFFHMASGLDFNEGYEGESDISNMLYTVTNASEYVKKLPLIHKPGTVFNYSTGDTQILSDVIQKAVGGTPQSAYNFYQKSLFFKLGITDAVVEHDFSGTFIGGARMFMRPRDWAKIGLMMSQHGEWQGKRVVPAEWIDEMLKPSPAEKIYGGQIWLYDPEVFGESFPKDAYALWGVLGQLIVVVPSRDLVVVRMGALGSDLPEDIEAKVVFQPVLKIINALPKE